METVLQAHCPTIKSEGCANSIKRALSKMEGVQSVSVDVENKHVTVRHDPAVVSDETLRQLLKDIGFPPE